MYGLLVESVRYYVIEKYGAEVWENVCKSCGLSNSVFASRETFPDNIMSNLANACSSELPCGLSSSRYMEYFGKCFVEFTSNHGYSRILKVYGRSFRDFLDSIDSLHEHLRFSFPKLQSPSFECREETSDGLTLHYRSRRHGFKCYVIGQVKEVAKRYFNLDVNIQVLDESDEMTDLTSRRFHTVFRVIFDNSNCVSIPNEQKFLRKKQHLPLDLVFEISPFSFLIDNNMRIYRAAKDINLYFGEDMAGKDLLQVFHIRRPPIQLSWEKLINHERVIFELVSKQASNMSLFIESTKKNSLEDSDVSKRDAIFLNKLKANSRICNIRNGPADQHRRRARTDLNQAYPSLADTRLQTENSTPSSAREPPAVSKPFTANNRRTRAMTLSEYFQCSYSRVQQKSSSFSARQRLPRSQLYAEDSCVEVLDEAMKADQVLELINENRNNETDCIELTTIEDRGEETAKNNSFLGKSRGKATIAPNDSTSNTLNISNQPFFNLPNIDEDPKNIEANSIKDSDDSHFNESSMSVQMKEENPPIITNAAKFTLNKNNYEDASNRSDHDERKVNAESKRGRSSNLGYGSLIGKTDAQPAFRNSVEKRCREKEKEFGKVHKGNLKQASDCIVVARADIALEKGLKNHCSGKHNDIQQLENGNCHIVDYSLNDTGKDESSNHVEFDSESCEILRHTADLQIPEGSDKLSDERHASVGNQNMRSNKTQSELLPYMIIKSLKDKLLRLNSFKSSKPAKKTCEVATTAAVKTKDALIRESASLKSPEVIPSAPYSDPSNRRKSEFNDDGESTSTKREYVSHSSPISRENFDFNREKNTCINTSTQKSWKSKLEKWLERQRYKPLHLRGQMKYIEAWNMVLFIGTPIIGNVADLRSSGLYLSDLSMHDGSRLLAMQGTQLLSEIEFACDREKLKAELLADTTKQLEEQKQRTETLLYSMMPREIAERMKNGDRELTTCETFDNVTILFGYVHNFTDICNKVEAMQVVELVGELFSLFDILTENYKVYKFETIGGGVYMLVSGVPLKIEQHANEMALVALHMLEAVQTLKDPISNEPLEFQIGIHSGPVVAGVIGQATLQYCLFGSTVNISSRMQTTGLPMKIHLSGATYRELEVSKFITEHRGQVPVKGVGYLSTYWLVGQNDCNNERNNNLDTCITKETLQDS